jgi:predicted AAA+ superfamily ATPase
MYLPRHKEQDILHSLQTNPVTAIIGPRQCGKSTLAKHLIQGSDAVYLDLERPSDLQKLTDAEWFLSSHRGRLICIDEVQRKPELFPLLRSLSDDWGGSGHFLILGSSSPELLRQSSESLAGRISYNYLTPFRFDELPPENTLEDFLVKGGFPRSLLAGSMKDSVNWRNDFITTFLERELLQWSGINTVVMRRLWQMLAHYNGQPVNYSALGNSLGVSNVTVRNYIDLLVGTFMVDALPPWHSNLKKRLVKAPRLYVADPGITTALLALDSFTQLSGHPAVGAVWEQVVLSHLRGACPRASFAYYRTAGGAETDIVMEHQGKVYAIECKASQVPGLSKGNFIAIADINPRATIVAAPVASGWPLQPGIRVAGLRELGSDMWG